MKPKRVAVNGADVAYWIKGPSNRLPLLLLHGLGGDHRGLDEITAGLKNLRVIALDLPGFGLSEPLKINHSLEHYADFIDQFANTVGLDTFFLAGHSFGASLALVYAGKFSDRVQKLCLMSPVTDSNTSTANLGKLYFNIAGVLPTKAKKFWFANRMAVYASNKVLFKTKSRSRKRRILNQDYVNYRRASERAIIEGYYSYHTTPFRQLAGRISADTLVVAGDADALVPVDALNRLTSVINSSRIILVEKAGHFLPLEEPVWSAQQLNQFFSGEHVGPKTPSRVGA